MILEVLCINITLWATIDRFKSEENGSTLPPPHLNNETYWPLRGPLSDYTKI